MTIILASICTALIVTIVRGSEDIAASLSCGFETWPCAGWENSGEDTLDWKLASSLVLDPLHSIPRPQEGSSFVHLGNGMGGRYAGSAWLISRRLPCLPRLGFLSFHFWKNSFLSGLFQDTGTPELRVFLLAGAEAAGVPFPLRRPEELRLLHSVHRSNKWGWRAESLQIPQSPSPFHIVIEGIVGSAFDVVALDNLQFVGNVSESVCGLPLDEFERASNSLAQAPISRLPSPLPRKWPAPTQHFWPTPAPSRGDAISREVEENGLFPSVSEARKIPEKMLKSQPPVVGHEPIPAASATVTPDQSVWTDDYGLPRFPGEEYLDDDYSAPPTPPPPELEKSPVRAEFKEAFQPQLSVIAKDGGVGVGGCPLVDCAFEGSSCELEGTENNKGAWVIMSGRIGSQLTGIPGSPVPSPGEFYAVAYSSADKSTQILRSQAFRLRSPGRLVFQYYFASAQAGRLVVCDGSLDQCLWERDGDNVDRFSRQWRQGVIQLPTGDHQILFVVEDLKEHFFVGLDEVRLVSVGDPDRPANCSPV